MRVIGPTWRDGAERRERPGRHAAESGLDAEQARERAGDADRAAAVGAYGERAHAGGNGGRASARRAPRCLGGVPRVARNPGQGIVANAFPAEFGRRGLAEEDCAVLAQARYHGSIVIPGAVAVGRFRAAQRGPALGVEQVLDRGRHAVDEAFGLAFHPARFGLPRGLQRERRIEVAEGVEYRVQRFDALQHRLRGFDGREALRAIEREEFGCGKGARVVRHLKPFLRRESGARMQPPYCRAARTRPPRGKIQPFRQEPPMSTPRRLRNHPVARGFRARRARLSSAPDLRLHLGRRGDRCLPACQPRRVRRAPLRAARPRQYARAHPEADSSLGRPTTCLSASRRWAGSCSRPTTATPCWPARQKT